MQQIELTNEIKESTERILAACEKTERTEYLACMIEQALGRVNSPALAAHYMNRAGIDGVIPAEAADVLEREYLSEALERLHRREQARKKKLDADVRALMGICTAEFQK